MCYNPLMICRLFCCARTGIASVLWLTILPLAILWLGGCSRPLFVVGDDALPQLELATVLPAEWTALNPPRTISIDGDAAEETLLFFRYDSGQVGAAIFDTQVLTDAAQLVSFYKPYILLPNYWSSVYSGEGQGFIAPPSESDNISVHPIDDGSASRRELVIRGGSTHLTFVWWREATQDYGVTQLVAPAGFRGIDWRDWESDPARIDTIVALYPFQDYRGRSLLCKAVSYTRLPPNADVPATTLTDANDSNAIIFERADQGIVFCSATAPAYPFYPEGVVLAYLAGADDADATEKFATPGISAAQIAAEINTRRLAGERIDDIATIPTIAALPDSQANSQITSPPATFVCVELSPLVGPGKRWLIVTLRYQPPDLDQRLPERWTISGATEEPAPVGEQQEPTCDDILRRGQPAPVH